MIRFFSGVVSNIGRGICWRSGWTFNEWRVRFKRVISDVHVYVREVWVSRSFVVVHIGNFMGDIEDKVMVGVLLVFYWVRDIWFLWVRFPSLGVPFIVVY